MGKKIEFWEQTQVSQAVLITKTAHKGCILSKYAETTMLLKSLLYLVEKETGTCCRKKIEGGLPFKNCSRNVSPPFMCSIAISSIASPGKAQEEIAASPLSLLKASR